MADRGGKTFNRDVKLSKTAKLLLGDVIIAEWDADNGVPKLIGEITAAAGSIGTTELADAGVTAAKIAAAVAGSGLAGGAGSALSVNVDDTGIEINTDILRLKDLGVTTGKLAADAVDNTKLADNAVSIENIDTGAKPIFHVVNGGLFTTLGGDASETITGATGVVGTDSVLVWVQKAGATPRTVDSWTPGTGDIAVTMSGDPSTDHKLAWIAIRAAV